MRRLLLAGAWLVTASAAALLALWLAGVSRLPFDWLWAYMPHLFLPAWIALVVAVVAGSRRLALVAAAVAAGHLVVLWPAMSGAPSSGRPDLRLVSANVLFHNEHWDALAAELLTYDADVLVLQESTPAALAALGPRLEPTYTHRTSVQRDDPLAAAVYSRLPLHDITVLKPSGKPLLAFTVEVAGHPARIWNVHTTAPSTRRGFAAREDMLGEMTRLRSAEHLPLVAAGDYNATSWHRSFAAFVDDGDLRDAHDAVGRGLDGTWKSLRLETLIDHVVVSDEWRVLDVGAGIGVGTDHRPVIVDLSWRRPPPRRGPG